MYLYSLLGLLLVGLLLLLVLLVGGSGLRHLFEVLEFVNKERSHDSILDLSSGKVATISSGNGSVAGVELLELGGSGDLNSLHLGSFGVLSKDMENESTT